MLDRAYGERNGEDSRDETVQHAEALEQLSAWSNEEFKSNLEPNHFEALTREDAKQKVLQEYDQRYRPELCQAERSLILEVLDTAWKDHLYYMDHLRSGIGTMS